MIFGDPSLLKVKSIETVAMTGIALPFKSVGLYFHCFTALIAALFMSLITPARTPPTQLPSLSLSGGTVCDFVTSASVTSPSSFTFIWSTTLMPTCSLMADSG